MQNSDMPRKMPNVPPFVKFVCANVPMVFDDSLSYYEALCALWKYVQGMTDVINNNATLEEEYIIKFDELKEFVDNYFDNLDVQEEINNKLDAMVEDGTLQELINNYLQPNVTWTFDTVTDMQNSENLIAGGYARTLGYYALNDGGGAIYHIRDKVDAESIDNAFKIAIGDDLVADLMFVDQINVLQLGVKNDYSTEATYLIQSAIDKVADFGLPMPIIIPAGKYLLGNLSIKKYSHIIGAGTGNTFFKAKDGLTDPLLSVTDDDAYYIKLQDFTIYGNRDNNTMPSAIYISRATATADPTDGPSSSSDMWLTFDNIRIANCYGHGIANDDDNVNNFREARLNNIVVNNCLGDGFHILGSDNHFAQLTAWSCSTNGFYIRGSANTFTDCKAFSCGLADYGSGWDIQGASDSYIECWAQENQGHGFKIENTTNSTFILQASTNGKGSLSDPSKSFSGIYIVPDTTVQRLNIIANCFNGTNSTYSQDYGISLGDLQSSTVILNAVQQNVATYEAPKSYVLSTVKNSININGARISTQFSSDLVISKSLPKITWSGANPAQDSRWELFESASGTLRVDHYYNDAYKSRPVSLSYDSGSNLNSVVLGTSTGKMGFFGTESPSTKKTLISPVATDAASAAALINEVVTDLIAYGLLTR